MHSPYTQCDRCDSVLIHGVTQRNGTLGGNRVTTVTLCVQIVSHSPCFVCSHSVSVTHNFCLSHAFSASHVWLSMSHSAAEKRVSVPHTLSVTIPCDNTHTPTHIHTSFHHTLHSCVTLSSISYTMLHLPPHCPHFTRCSTMSQAATIFYTMSHSA